MGIFLIIMFDQTVKLKRENIITSTIEFLTEKSVTLLVFGYTCMCFKQLLPKMVSQLVNELGCNKHC